MKNSEQAPKARGRSCTADILGLGARPPRVPSQWTKQYSRLRELRDWFLGQRDTSNQSARTELQLFSEHMADAATDSYDRDCALALLSSAQNALYEIDGALSRLEQGSYGICEMTGEPIERARLEAIPWTRFSAQAQAQLEARGLNTRPHLGSVGTMLPETRDRDNADSEDLEEATVSSEKQRA